MGKTAAAKYETTNRRGRVKCADKDGALWKGETTLSRPHALKFRDGSRLLHRNESRQVSDELE